MTRKFTKHARYKCSQMPFRHDNAQLHIFTGHRKALPPKWTLVAQERERKRERETQQRVNKRQKEKMQNVQLTTLV